jgi:hypothetical protein
MVSSRPAQTKLASPYLKKRKGNKRAGGVAHMLEHWPSKRLALYSIPVLRKRHCLHMKGIGTWTRQCILCVLRLLCQALFCCSPLNQHRHAQLMLLSSICRILRRN